MSEKLANNPTGAKEIRHIPFEGTDAFAVAELYQRHKQILYVLDDAEQLSTVATNLQFIWPGIKIWVMPSWDSAPYDVISSKQSIMASRVAALRKLYYREPGICLTSITSVAQKLPPAETLMSYATTLKVGESVNRDNLLSTLSQYGYERSPVAINVGEMAVRGSIIDLIPTPDHGIRLDFLGNTLEYIKHFNPETQLSVTPLEQVVLIPLSELIFTEQQLQCFKQQYYQYFHSNQYTIANAILEGSKAAGAEHLLPLFYPHMDTIMDYVGNDTLLCMHHSIWKRLTKYWQRIEESYQDRLKAPAKNIPYPALTPTSLYLEQPTLIQLFNQCSSVLLTPWAERKAGYQAIPSLAQLALLKQTSVFEILRNYGITYTQRVIIACYSIGSRERLKEILAKHEILAINVDSWEATLTVPHNTISLVLFTLEHGFSTAQHIIFSEQDVLGERLSRVNRSAKPHQRFLTEAVSLHPGDIVVHIEHGIGQFIGLDTMDIQGKVRDFIKIGYAGGDRLYVPVENFDLLTKYAEEGDIQLDKLGSSSWQNRKARLKKRIKIAAAELVKIAAKRSTQQAPLFEASVEQYTLFCEKFPYVETEDQIRAIDDVLADLASGKPTDRLICGDVGFGKTEVAMRAACSVVTSIQPMQVAIIVPTTLLARQHYNTFTQRFSGLPVSIAQLSKFVSPKEAAATKKALMDGKIDIVIGTHSLLAKSISFKHLGLIIIDEEQHFGVGQKEALKKLRSNSHVITLSATPIPRTLHMSLTGIKELSIIGTPPIDRLAIRTTVLTELDPLTIREAVLREKMRGGRTFYVTPQISYMHELKEHLQAILPEVKIVQAHGQLTASQLDQVMNDFYDGKYDVLLSTAIVESGLDIPMANTIIVDRADHFGLTKLYQIRGRVGRGKIQSYAYLIASRKVSEIGRKRLEVLSACEALGSGFSIASQDMDMRGFGNIVGEEQSGHIREVGVELYQEMLQNAIQEISGSKHEEEEEWSPILNIGLAVQIPASYISDASVRLSLYRQLARSETTEELERLVVEIIDRFGAPVPDTMNQLIHVVELKQLAKQKGIAKIERGEKGVMLGFRSHGGLEEATLRKLLAQYSGQMKLRPDGRLILLASWQDDQHFLQDLHSLLSEL